MVRSGLLSILLLAVASTVAFPVFAQPAEIRTVWRADWRSPEDVFLHGFTGGGTRSSVLDHATGHCDVSGGATSSQWVSMSARYEYAFRFSERRLRYPGVPTNRMWIYEIRPDNAYISVEDIVRQVTAAAETGRHGYDASHTTTLRRALYRTPALYQQEVLALRVNRANIRQAMPVWLGAGGAMTAGGAVTNAAYIAADTHVQRTVSNDSLQVFVPASSIRDYGNAASSCSMSCDRANYASSRAAVPEVYGQGFCAAYAGSGMTLEKLQILLD
jgi:hypothetical protein